MKKKKKEKKRINTQNSIWKLLIFALKKLEQMPMKKKNRNFDTHRLLFLDFMFSFIDAKYWLQAIV